jgi:hypothetical protein
MQRKEVAADAKEKDSQSKGSGSNNNERKAGVKANEVAATLSRRWQQKGNSGSSSGSKGSDSQSNHP